MPRAAGTGRPSRWSEVISTHSPRTGPPREDARHVTAQLIPAQRGRAQDRLPPWVNGLVGAAIAVGLTAAGAYAVHHDRALDAACQARGRRLAHNLMTAETRCVPPTSTWGRP